MIPYFSLYIDSNFTDVLSKIPIFVYLIVFLLFFFLAVKFIVRHVFSFLMFIVVSILLIIGLLTFIRIL